MGKHFVFVHFSIQQHVLGSHSQIFAQAGLCLCVYQTMCAHPLVAICTTSQQAAVPAAPSIWLWRLATLVTCRCCPWDKWNLTSVSGPPCTLCRWRCNQLSWPLNGSDCSSILKQTGEQIPIDFYTEVWLGITALCSFIIVLLFYISPLKVFRYSCWAINMTDYKFFKLHCKETVFQHLKQAIKAAVELLFSELPRHKWKQFICVKEEACDTLSHMPVTSEKAHCILEVKIRLIVAQSMPCPVSFPRRSSFHSLAKSEPFLYTWWKCQDIFSSF